jgi:hypothetical protein
LLISYAKSTALTIPKKNRHQPARQPQHEVQERSKVAQGAAGSFSLVTFFLRKKESDIHRLWYKHFTYPNRAQHKVKAETIRKTVTKSYQQKSPAQKCRALKKGVYLMLI